MAAHIITQTTVCVETWPTQTQYRGSGTVTVN